MSSEVQNIEELLQKATNPLDKIQDPNIVQLVCHVVASGPTEVQTALRVLVHKIQSPQEKEALYALTVLEACVNSCGPEMHVEIGKFRFLNEMVKMVSPKYYGNTTSERVKKKIIELLYCWTNNLKNEAKISEAYNMLKAQGVIKSDPLYLIQGTVPSKKPVCDPYFKDEEKSSHLQLLLQSKSPEDLHKANLLIQCAVKEEERKTERKNRTNSEVEMATNNVQILNEMLNNCEGGSASDSDLELMSEVFTSCTNLRVKIHGFISEVDENDEILGKLLQSHDDLCKVIERYKFICERSKSTKKIKECYERNSKAETDLLSNSQAEVSELVCLNEDSFALESLSLNSPALPEPVAKSNNVMSLPNNSLSLQLNSETNSQDKLNTEKDIDNILSSIPLNLGSAQSSNQDANYTFAKPADNVNSHNEASKIDTDLLDFDISPQDAVSNNNSDFNIPFVSDSLLDLCCSRTTLENIRPGSRLPIQIFDKDGIKVTLHFADNEQFRNINVIVLTTVSVLVKPVSNYSIQVVAPQGCKTRLQAPSSSRLPAFCPFLPPPACAHILFLGHSFQFKLQLKVMISYAVSGETVAEICQIEI